MKDEVNWKVVEDFLWELDIVPGEARDVVTITLEASGSSPNTGKITVVQLRRGEEGFIACGDDLCTVTTEIGVEGSL